MSNKLTARAFIKAWQESSSLAEVPIKSDVRRTLAACARFGNGEWVCR